MAKIGNFVGIPPGLTRIFRRGAKANETSGLADKMLHQLCSSPQQE
ncbi:hypothetical protein SAMN05428978_10569 [Nitrosomonas sp. Nm34]|nr:hypothetical protein SAMN05428978_10569 [Nitrosomonas sp. Nm34]